MTQNKSALSHSAAPDSLSALRAAPLQTPRAVEGSELPARLTSLHSRIMNIPCVYPANVVQGDEWAVYCFKRGHKEARHAAAELALVADDLLAALKAVPSRPDFPSAIEYADAIDAWWDNTARAAINRATS